MTTTSDGQPLSPSCEGSRLIRKPLELMCCAPGQSLSFTQRRILTAICDAVIQFGDTELVCVSPRELSFALYNGGKNLRELYVASSAMRDMKAWLNPLDEHSAPETIGVFDEVTCSSREISYKLNPKIGQLIRAGECLAEVDPLIEKKLAAANAVALYELAELFMHRRERPAFSTAHWRQLITGSSTKENQRFVTSHIMARSAAVLEAHAGIRLAVVRPHGPRVDLVRVCLRRISRIVQSDAEKELAVPDELPEPTTTTDGPLWEASSGALDGLDSFEQLLESWNSQFGGIDRCSTGQSVAMDVGALAPEPGAGTPSGCNEVIAAWREAQIETGRLQEQLRRAELTEREAALRALRMAVQRYQATPEEVFGSATQADDVSRLSTSQVSATDAVGDTN